ncbi:heterokaryon incompatibility protein-domain-containing protein [Cladorrhinum sp. PSN259]|nr:heterokaryon incompatibility protein-domain-containing protein [Cladorrhinum sp. PSN259]
MPSDAARHITIASSLDTRFLYNKIWMSNSAAPGQVLIAQLNPSTDSTKLFPLEVMSLRSIISHGPPPDGKVDGERPLFGCRGQLRLDDELLDIPHGREGSVLERLDRDGRGLGVGSVLVDHQDADDEKANPLLHSYFGREQFRVTAASPSPNSVMKPEDVYFGVDARLYTPDGHHPFRGVWMWELAMGEFEFLLLHQESESRIELIKLTGAEPVPNGVTSIIAEDIRNVRRQSSDSDEEWKWNEVPIVRARLQGSESAAGEIFFLDVELALVSDKEMVVLLPEAYGNPALQLKRAELSHFISPGELVVSDCCLCNNSEQSSETQKNVWKPVKTSQSSWSVSGDAELLGLGRDRGAALSAFETPGEPRRQGSVALHHMCRCCASFFSQVQLERHPDAILLPPESQHRLHERVDGLRDSAAAGCHFCSLVQHSLTAAGWFDSNDNQGIYLVYSCFEGSGRERVGFGVDKAKPVPPLEKPTIYVSLHPTGESMETFIKPGVIPPNWYKFRSITSGENESHPSKVPHRAATQPETSSSSHMDLARSWLEQCSTHHAALCGNQQDPNFIPTRLLDVRGPGIRLTITGSTKHREPPIYCCLSHCWGGVTDIPLLKCDTLQSFMSGIDITSLPRTFQDAILISRQLGVRYLWIDSLCILQDSTDDWTREAVVMGNIYQNGYCTISAAEAQSGHGGCFVRRNPLNCNPVRVTKLKHSEMLLQPSEYPSVQTSGSGAKRNVDVPAPRLKILDVFTSKLASRGWVFQEALLSPRILYFGHGLFWNCRAGQASELDPLGRGMLHMGVQYGAAGDAIFREPPEAPRSGLAKRRSAVSKRASSKEAERSQVLDQIFFMVTAGRPTALGSPGRAEYNAVCALAEEFASSGKISSKKLHTEWMRLVAVYSRRQLTFESDRLPALAGIVQTVILLAGDVLRGQYLAGMWKCTLVFDLLWSQGAPTIEGHEPRPRVAGNECPSWSWASIGGAVGSVLATWRDDWADGMELFVDVVSASAGCDPLDTARTGKVTGGKLTVKGLAIPCRIEETRYTTGNELNVQLVDGEPKTIGEAQPDTDPYEFVDGATFAVPFLRMKNESKADLHGLVLVQKGNIFLRVAKWTATTPSDESLDITRYEKFARTIIIC